MIPQSARDDAALERARDACAIDAEPVQRTDRRSEAAALASNEPVGTTIVPAHRSRALTRPTNHRAVILNALTPPETHAVPTKNAFTRFTPHPAPITNAFTRPMSDRAPP